MSWINDLKERLDEALPGLAVGRDVDTIYVEYVKKPALEERRILSIDVGGPTVVVRGPPRQQSFMRTPGEIEEAFAYALRSVLDRLHERRRMHHQASVELRRLIVLQEPTEEA